MHYFTVEAAAVAPFLEHGNNRVICTINETESFHCAILTRKDGSYFVNVGSKICKKLEVGVGSSIEVVFEIDRTENQFAVPEEWTAVLASDEEAAAIFNGLSAGNKRSLLYLVAQVKTPEKRIERALKIAEKIKAGIFSARIILK